MGVLFFWLSLTIKIFYADFTSLPYESLSISPNIVQTTYISLFSFCFFCGGLYLAVKNMNLSDLKMKELFSKPYSNRNILIVYVSAIFISFFLKGILFFYPGFHELFAAFLQIKVALMFLLIFTTIRDKKNLLIVSGILLVEIIISLFSFFSSFKDFFITIIVVISIFPIKLSISQRIIALAVFGGFLYSIFLWQSIKGDYRAFLNGGKQSQQIVVTQEEALRKIQELSAKGNTSNEDIIYKTIDRISYIEFFSESTDNVPYKIPYEGGTLWKNNILHILEPRILFPDKSEIDDSKMVNKYATQKVATSAGGASFSLGFLAESYIDFGPLFMFIPIFIVGWLFGFIYKLIILKSINYLWGFTMVTPLWFNINCVGTPGTKIFGWLLMYFIAFIIFRFALMKPLNNYIESKTSSSS